VLPIVACLAETAAGVILAGEDTARCAVLAACTGLLLVVGIHNAWDIAMWTITRRQG
jgi:hypothetical protein